MTGFLEQPATQSLPTIAPGTITPGPQMESPR